MTHHNSHAARIDGENVVREIIVIPYMNDDDEQITNYCNSIGLEGRWIDTSYKSARRGKYAGIGYTYDPDTDTFTPPPTPEVDDESDL